METLKTCACGREFTENESSGETCFPCKLGAVGFGFRGVTGPGRKNFNSHTIRSYVEAGDREIRRQGGDPKKDFEFTGNRWV